MQLHLLNKAIRQVLATKNREIFAIKTFPAGKAIFHFHVPLFPMLNYIEKILKLKTSAICYESRFWKIYRSSSSLQKVSNTFPLHHLPYTQMLRCLFLISHISITVSYQPLVYRDTITYCHLFSLKLKTQIDFI